MPEHPGPNRLQVTPALLPRTLAANACVADGLTVTVFGDRLTETEGAVMVNVADADLVESC